MITHVFVDTGAWLALIDQDDQHHVQARKIYRELLEQKQKLLTTNLVVAETYNLVRRRIGYPAAMQFLRSIRSTTRLVRIYSNASLEKEAESILERFSDQDFSFVDAVSFAVMRQRETRQAFAFDKHFLIAGFELLT
ncbi:MAG: type II toxin-antitoxin system VapC family toxin [Chloroflexi bacterium]|nr:type II toxin-antitoxin system VapC family toxin [Chloroflexota bacterium]